MNLCYPQAGYLERIASSAASLATQLSKNKFEKATRQMQLLEERDPIYSPALRSVQALRTCPELARPTFHESTGP